MTAVANQIAGHLLRHACPSCQVSHRPPNNDLLWNEGRSSSTTLISVAGDPSGPSRGCEMLDAEYLFRTHLKLYLPRVRGWFFSMHVPSVAMAIGEPISFVAAAEVLVCESHPAKTQAATRGRRTASRKSDHGEEEHSSESAA